MTVFIHTCFRIIVLLYTVMEIIVMGTIKVTGASIFSVEN